MLRMLKGTPIGCAILLCGIQQDNAGQAAVKAAMKDAEALVTATYGMFVDIDGHDGEGDDDQHHQLENGLTVAGPDTDTGDSDRRRTVAV